MVVSTWACLGLLTVGLCMGAALPARILLPFNLEYDADPAWSLDTYGDPAALTDAVGKTLGLHLPPRPDAAKLMNTAREVDSSNSLQQNAQAFGAHGDAEEMLGAVGFLPNMQKLRPAKRYLGIELPDYIASKKELGKLKEKMLNSGK
ncbi:uncharacterized protein LOC125028574 [Penaeus chinensis]|uniref:uncharacterized protein LOC125028574 n=1 Tax=Penaeus chinensis TaxID=139456 RepID=UPI001FB62075|nr:uncharacterized protein LOC125028574 [Penaeus chinensis]